MDCHQCGAVIAANDLFCEACGTSLVNISSSQDRSDRCQKCGAGADRIDVERYCLECGFRQIVPTHDTIELQPAPNLAGASNRGRRHHQNEDAIALDIVEPNTSVLVVCDGVSSSQHPELASQAAATACAEAICAALVQGTSDPAIALFEGVDAALRSVASIPIDRTSARDPSSTTIVTAIVRDNIATIGWLGDSRAYWLSPDKSSQLTQDDSWLREAVEAGYTLAEAEASPYAHAIVRWLGADTLEADSQPNLVTFPLPGAGYLLLCSDGLWNYAPEPAYLYHLLQQAPDDRPIAISRHFIDYANQQGGQDNITVGILAVTAENASGDRMS
jgi:PPM family protein phosphatase